MGSDLHQAVLQYARGHQGKKVGDGTCWALANEALNSTNAKSANDYGVVSSTSNDRWGQPVSVEDAQPGDILQFKGHVATVTVTTKTKISFPNKDWIEYEYTETHTYSRGHHTAILETGLDNGVMTVWEQHVKRGHNVVEETTDVGTIYVNGSRSEKNSTERIQITPTWGQKVKSCFTQKADQAQVDKLVKLYNGGTYMAKVQTTNEIAVTGTINAYTPEPKR